MPFDTVPTKQPSAGSGRLLPDRYTQRDFFVADILDAAPKDDIASMEHPLFALKAGDRRIRRYEHNGQSIEVQPGAKGLATIHDKDIWIYCISQLVEAMNRGRNDTDRTIHFTAYDFLSATNRGTSGRSYERLSDTLERLAGSRIITNIKTNDIREKAGFGLIEAFRIIERSSSDNRMVAVSVVLPEWLYRSVKTKQVLTLSREYFRLRKPLDRRIYELARKHCGAQPKWGISLSLLRTKAGSTASLREFRRLVKELAESNSLPDYQMAFNHERDTMTFYARGPKGAKARIGDLLTARGVSSAKGERG
ncbi:Plasmid replication initiator protein [Cupriavidus sp. YR651]|uniref:replication initiator protein A n=1 Tax=Cupriavidus sp. YR651 TaxID=1855315 RepID=UPI0008902369|nr:replication initiator protein A [Cupriavidus sp. YR651]SDD17508.1 Plasmid replication initiator protein [Cupriavidus sp. YR651]